MVRPDASGQFSQQSGTWVLGFAIGRPVPHGTGASGRAPREVQHGEELIGRAMRPVTRDRTCPVAMGALWTTTGRWYCLVRLLRGARPVNASRHSRCVIGASGQFDQRVRSARLRLFEVTNGYIRRGTSINTRWRAQGSYS
jgi:hypothetical protein